jgi:NADPH:quinone reductase-like Zn-dependent oxidoreductase
MRRECLLTVVFSGTGGVAVFAIKLSRAAGARVILSSSSDEKIAAMKERYSNPPILTVNYEKPDWHEEVMRLTNGVGVDLVLENGGTSSVVQSVKCTRRGGIVSQVGYLGKQDPSHLGELLPTLIDRRVNLRYVIRGGAVNACTTASMKRKKLT